MEWNWSPYLVLLNDLSLIPAWHYLVASLVICLGLVYHFLEFHFVEDLLTGFRGSFPTLTHNPSSHIYHDVVSKCRILHSRYSVTPWLSSPNLQTVFLGLLRGPPSFNYRRQLFHLSDGGTIALDWLLTSDVLETNTNRTSAVSKDDITPIVLAIPGLTSDSESEYMRHLAFNTAQKGWNVVVSNHRGLGGVPITSDSFYNAGWTEDLRAVTNHLHVEYPKAPLFLVGTSIGANIVVKYLGEDGDSVPFAGAVAICSPWDLLIGDRFISRRLLQKIYGRALAIGLQGYAQLHQPVYSRLANWEGIKKSRSIRDFDHHATRLVGKYETVDTYYRRCSSTSYVGKVSVPLLCISALDDPVCTREAIPWDECRANVNIVLATTKHGGHLAFFEGLTASSLWWVKAVGEFLKVLHSSHHMHVQKVASACLPSTTETSIDQGPYVNIAEDGLVAAVVNEQVEDKTMDNVLEPGEAMISAEGDQQMTQPESDTSVGIGQSSVRKCFDLVSRQSGWSFGLLVYIAIVTSWPLVGSVLKITLQKKLRNVLPAVFLKR